MLTAFAGKHVPSGDEHHKIESILESLVDSTARSPNGETLGSCSSDQPHAISPAVTTRAHHGHWWKKFFGDENRLDELFASHHLGNYVQIRGQPGVKIFESMPIYVRVGMHLLFSGSLNTSLLKYKSVSEMLKAVSIRQGKVYDDSTDPKAVLEHIQDFIKTYSINLNELEQPDPTRYPTFNEFFFRKLAKGHRPIAEEGNNRIVSSSADCRLVVFNDSESATKTWIKGRRFDLTHLVGDASLADREFPPGSAIAIFRLAPADYHRYHHSVGPAVCGPTKHVDGEYYTVNPQAVNETFDVFTSNRRDVLTLNWSPTENFTVPVAMVSIGAMLVGSIAWTKANQGDLVERGEEAGYFAYGGSTVILVFPLSAKIQWDEDLLQSSAAGLETMVRVGERIGISCA